MSGTVMAFVALGWALVGSGALATAVLRARKKGSPGGGEARRGAHPGGSIQVLLVRPCAGAEEGLEERLVSIASARCAVRPRVCVAIAQADDPAAAPARAACARLRAEGWDAEVRVTGARGANRKVGQIAAVAAVEAAEVVLWADSDVDLGGTDLDALVAPLLADPGIAAVWAPVVERGPAATLGDRVSEAILGGSLHAFPLLAHLDPRGLVGKLVAVRAAALAAVDFASMGDVLGEDMELAARLHGGGRRVVLAETVGVARPRGRTLGAVVGRFARWISMVRAQRPARLAGYPLVLVATPFVLALAGAALAAGARPALVAVVVAVALATRLATAHLAARAGGRRSSAFGCLADAVLADAALLVAFARALSSRRLSWRGRALRLGAGGRLEEVPPGRATVARVGPRLAATALVLGASLAVIGAADALPRPGTEAPRARVHDPAGRVLRLERLRGKPVLIVYESRESNEENQTLKDRLSRLARDGRYRNRVHLVPVASVEAFDYFPIRGLVEDSIASESQRIGTTIYCDWDGSFRRALALRPERSSVVLVARDGRVIFAYEGPLTRRAQDRLIELLGRETEDAASGPPREEALRQRPEPAGPRLVPGREGVGASGPQSRVDGVELGRDGTLLPGPSHLDVAGPRRGPADRDPQIRSLAGAEVVAERDRDRDGLLGDPRDGRRSGLERERAFGDGALAPLREDPHEAPRRREQTRGVPDRARPVGAVVEVDPEGAHVREERQAAQVLGVHQGVRVDLQDAGAQDDGHEGVPPGRVVRHDQHGTLRARLAEGLEPAHAHAREGRLQARLGVPREPPAEQARLVGRDHGARLREALPC